MVRASGRTAAVAARAAGIGARGGCALRGTRSSVVEMARRGADNGSRPLLHLQRDRRRRLGRARASVEGARARSCGSVHGRRRLAGPLWFRDDYATPHADELDRRGSNVEARLVCGDGGRGVRAVATASPLQLGPQGTKKVSTCVLVYSWN